MLMTVVVAVVLLGLALQVVMASALRRQLAVPTPRRSGPLPPVSVLKPLKGADPGLESNLESFFSLDYPELEIVLGCRDGDDPALAVARRVAAAHPDVPSRVVVDRREVGFNPKVSNLANLLARARHDTILISDSNVRVRAPYLRDLVLHLQQPGVGLVSSPFRGVGSGSVGTALETLQLNTFVLGGVSAMARVVGGVCVVGKSMLLRRETLAAVGGFERLARYLAEDQVCGEDVAATGARTVVSGHLVDNVLGPLSVKAFLARHLRWARIRRRISPLGYLGEALLNPVFVAAVATAASMGRAWPLLAAAVAVGSVLAAVAERRVGVRRPPWSYPLLVLAKELLVGVAWAVPFLSSSVRWRGNRLRLGPRTLLVAPGGAPAASAPGDGELAPARLG